MSNITYYNSTSESSPLRVKQGHLPIILAGVGLTLLAVISGMAVAVFGIQAAVFLTVLVLGAASLFFPLRYIVVILFIVGFVVMGQLIYFARIDKAAWLPFLLGLLLYVRLPGELMHRNLRNPAHTSYQPVQSNAVVGFLVLYFSTVVATTLINQSAPLQVFISSKEYLFLWGLYFVISTGLIAPELMTRIWNLLPWLLPLQLPLIFYQRFYVATQRADIRLGAEWDAVVGAFGGNPDGGGSSGAMGIFVVIAMTLALARWRQGSFKGTHCCIILASGLTALLLAEVKFAVLLLPISIAVAFRREFLARPVAAFFALIAAGLIAALILFSYKAQFSNESIERSTGNYFEHIYKASTDDRFINLQTGEIGRVAAIRFWADQQTGGVGTLIGEGMGASRKGSMVVGPAAKRWMFNIARSSLAILLWETGLLGTAAFILMLVAAYFYAHKIAGDPRTLPEERPILLTCCAGLVLLLLELPYNTDIFYAPQIQILMMLFLGQVSVSGGRLAAIGAIKR